MIVLVAVIVGVVSLFGIEASRLALTDLAALETQEAAQRAAEAATARAADMLAAGGSTDAEIDTAARDEAMSVADANLARGDVQSLSVSRTSSVADFVRVDLTLVSAYGGFIGPRQLSATGSAAVPRP